MTELVLIVCVLSTLNTLEMECRERVAGRDMQIYECISQSQQLAAQYPLKFGEKIAKIRCLPAGKST